MRLNIGVIDYGMGNLHSVAKAIASQGDCVTVTDSRSKLKSSDVVILPGVGAFGAAMKTLAKKKLDDFVGSWIDSGRPYLGICLGFQLLFERSEESPREKGLSVFGGDVVRFRPKDFKGKPYQIPHMGWNEAEVRGRGNGLIGGSKKDRYFYFVHSFFPQPKDKNMIYTETEYGRKFCSSIANGSLFASQFHPEKSGTVGLKLIKNFLNSARKEKERT